MDFSIVYIFARFFFRVRDFFHHWYVDSSRLLFGRLFSILAEVDKTIALRLTIKHFTEPLYKDYSIVGRVLGIVFRSGRILLGVVFYPAIGIVFFAIYGTWLIIPPLIVLYAFGYF